SGGAEGGCAPEEPPDAGTAETLRANWQSKEARLFGAGLPAPRAGNPAQRQDAQKRGGNPRSFFMPKRGGFRQRGLPSNSRAGSAQLPAEQSNRGAEA
ncbi:hypothetical protein, partial [Treponema endosymbiont of Eucomonympha sp.]|uniref:hypothetical protein n=1 Tax=Treponema endosymbiont of Eucomonympha sp. TaxID=1580831 RepID=UPI000AE7B4B6